MTKEVVDRENRLAANPNGIQNPIASGVTLMPHQIPSTTYPNYPGNDVPLVQVVLSPIQELDGSGSVNNTLHPGQPGTAALAQAILSPGLGPVLTTTPVSLPMTVSQLTSLGLAPLTNSPLVARQLQERVRTPTFLQRNVFKPPSPPPGKPAETSDSDEEAEQHHSGSSNSSQASDVSNASKNSKKSNDTNTTASISSKKYFDVQRKTSDNADVTPSHPPVDVVISSTSSAAAVETEDRSRKTSTASNAGKRGEVYV